MEAFRVLKPHGCIIVGFVDKERELGSDVDMKKVMTIALLPENDPDKVIFVGNESLMGVKMSSLTNCIRKYVMEPTERMTNLNCRKPLPKGPLFDGTLFAPCSINKLPKLKTRMEARRALRK